jgi:hypothetical protein
MLIITVINAKGKKLLALAKPCILSTPVVVKVNNDTHVNIGQGLGETK